MHCRTWAHAQPWPALADGQQSQTWEYMKLFLKSYIAELDLAKADVQKAERFSAALASQLSDLHTAFLFQGQRLKTEQQTSRYNQTCLNRELERLKSKLEAASRAAAAEAQRFMEELSSSQRDRQAAETGAASLEAELGDCGMRCSAAEADAAKWREVAEAATAEAEAARAHAYAQEQYFQHAQAHADAEAAQRAEAALEAAAVQAQHAEAQARDAQIAIAEVQAAAAEELARLAGDLAQAEERVAGAAEVPTIDITEVTEKKVLGLGGFGVVCRVDTETFGPAAMKEFHGKTTVKYLVHEADMMAIISHHPNIVSVLARVAKKGQLCGLLVQLCKGGSLEQLLRSLGSQLDDDRLLSIATNVATGLAFLHSRGIVHGDVKLENVLLSEAGAAGRALLADLGCAGRIDDGKTAPLKGVTAHMCSADLHSRMRAHKSLRAGPEEDVFQFGMVLYSLLVRDHKAAIGTAKDKRLSLEEQNQLYGKAAGEWAEVAAIAHSCVRPFAPRRPSMQQVLAQLRALAGARAEEAAADGAEASASGTVSRIDCSTDSGSDDIAPDGDRDATDIEGDSDGSPEGLCTPDGTEPAAAEQSPLLLSLECAADHPAEAVAGGNGCTGMGRGSGLGKESGAEGPSSARAVEGCPQGQSWGRGLPESLGLCDQELPGGEAQIVGLPESLGAHGLGLPESLGLCDWELPDGEPQILHGLPESLGL